MSIYSTHGGNPEDSLPDEWKQLEAYLSHRQGHITGGSLKRLYEASTHILAMYKDQDLCVCDSGDFSVGMHPITCEAHMLAYLVDALIQSSRLKKEPA